ncbi:ExbD/TolR family protein [Chitinophaga alhagiae]|uniref:ExbD/TolR family protein n=1 Tax=Chitinophaga alhagiae TaxID=2203219 RepID=UPI000E5B024F|nr:biopolymer transporter ExbD [Chitinophaga alhagiae]
MNLRRRKKGQAEMHNGALNDILFILLLFFLIVSSLANPNVIKLMLPKAKSNTKAKQTVVVSIDAGQQFYVGTQKVSFEQLRAVLVPKIPLGEVDPTIVINAEETVPISAVVSVMQIARELGAKTVLGTANPQSAAGNKK